MILVFRRLRTLVLAGVSLALCVVSSPADPLSVRQWDSSTPKVKSETSKPPKSDLSAAPQTTVTVEKAAEPAATQPASELSPEPSPIPEPVATTPTSKPVSEAKNTEAIPPEALLPAVEPEPKKVKAIAKKSDDTTAHDAQAAVASKAKSKDSNHVYAANETPPDTEIKAGQVKTHIGTIDLNAVSLDTLNKELGNLPTGEEMKISLKDCVDTALKSNRDILVSAYEPKKSDGDILQAKGEFDPVLKSDSSYTHSETSASSQVQDFAGGGLGGSGGGGGGLLGGLGGGLGGLGGLGGNNNIGLAIGLKVLSAIGSAFQQGISLLTGGGNSGGLVIVDKNATTDLSLEGKVPWGTKYQLKFNIQDEKSTYNSFQDEYSGGLTLSVTQPLLRGRGKTANLARVRIAKNNRKIAETDFERTVMSTVSQVVKAYWDLVGATQQLRVRQTSLENAQKLQDINQRRLEIGSGAALEVVQAKASVAQRTGDVISARSQVLAAQDRLKLLLEMRDKDNFSANRLVPTDEPTAEEINLDEGESIKTALENRPEMKSANLQVDSATIERLRAANDMLPQVDIGGSIYQGGRGAEASDVFDGIVDRKDKTYSVSLTGSVPITNRAGRGAYEKALQSKRQAEERVQKTMGDLTLDVRNAVRSVATSRVLVESSKQARALQQTNVDAEEKRLKLGVTTSFEVLRTQEDLTAAQVQEVQALIDFEKTLTDLQLAQGTILTNLGVDVDIPEPEKPIGFWRSIVPPTPKEE